MNWKNLEADLEEAGKRVTEQTPYHIIEMHAAIYAWPGLKTIMLRLIHENRRLNKEVKGVYDRLQQSHEADREYAAAYRELLSRGEVPEGRPGMPRDSMG